MAKPSNKPKLHSGPQIDCPKCGWEPIGMDECFRQISGKKKVKYTETDGEEG